jgi:aminopeptidase N
MVLSPAEVENIRLPQLGPFTAEQILAHELAHQWFGDLVTCKDWSHTWLNEGFATYYTLLFLKNKYGNDEFLYNLYKDEEEIFKQKGDERPIVYRDFRDPWEQFDERTYSRASLIIHMIHSQIGDALFKRSIKTYLDRYRYKTAVSSDFSKIIEELSGQSYDRFFDEWFLHSGLPELSVHYYWDEKAKLAKISITQKGDSGGGFKRRNSPWDGPQSTGSKGVESSDAKNQPKLFHFPLTIRFKTKDENIDRQVLVNQREETFYFNLKHAPDAVRIDPELNLLGEIEFDQPEHMLIAQLTDKSDLVGRLEACDALGERKTDKALGQLKAVLSNDVFYGVRIKAAEALVKIHTDAALDALIASTAQTDARARQAVVRAIAKFYGENARDALLKIMQNEHNPAITCDDLEGLGIYHTEQIRDLLIQELKSNSFQNMLASAAIAAIRSQDDAGYSAKLKETLSEKESSFTSQGLAQGLDTLAYINRNEKNRDDVREFILAYTKNKREKIQVGAIRALGTLEDPKSIAILQTYASASKDSPPEREARRAISILRSANKPSDNLHDLRQEVIDLQTENRGLKKEFESIKKRLSADEQKKKH